MAGPLKPVTALSQVLAFDVLQDDDGELEEGEVDSTSGSSLTPPRADEADTRAAHKIDTASHRSRPTSRRQPRPSATPRVRPVPRRSIGARGAAQKKKSQMIALAASEASLAAAKMRIKLLEVEAKRRRLGSERTGRPVPKSAPALETNTADSSEVSSWCQTFVSDAQDRAARAHNAEPLALEPMQDFIIEQFRDSAALASISDSDSVTNSISSARSHASRGDTAQDRRTAPQLAAQHQPARSKRQRIVRYFGNDGDILAPSPAPTTTMQAPQAPHPPRYKSNGSGSPTPASPHVDGLGPRPTVTTIENSVPAVVPQARPAAANRAPAPAAPATAAQARITTTSIASADVAALRTASANNVSAAVAQVRPAKYYSAPAAVA